MECLQVCNPNAEPSTCSWLFFTSAGTSSTSKRDTKVSLDGAVHPTRCGWISINLKAFFDGGVDLPVVLARTWRHSSWLEQLLREETVIKHRQMLNKYLTKTIAILWDVANSCLVTCEVWLNKKTTKWPLMGDMVKLGVIDQFWSIKLPNKKSTPLAIDKKVVALYQGSSVWNYGGVADTQAPRGWGAGMLMLIAHPYIFRSGPVKRCGWNIWILMIHTPKTLCQLWL